MQAPSALWLGEHNLILHEKFKTQKRGLWFYNGMVRAEKEHL